MIDFDDTEAAHLAEIYDDSCEIFEPYTNSEKRDYIRAKNCCFRKQDIGKFVVVQNPRRNKSVMKLLYLVDRKKTKRFWWSHEASYAMVFDKKSAAEVQANRYRFNKARVVEIKSHMADIKGYLEEYGTDYL